MMQVITSGYATMVHGRGAIRIALRSTTTFANLEITSL